MLKISVVMFIYNAEEFLEETLSSIMEQTLKDIEIICVNDGSEDNSLTILEEHSKKDNRIKVISQETQNQIVATNIGIAHAGAQYIYLMEKDTVLESNTLELAYNKAKKTGVDMVVFKSLNFDTNKQIYYETANDSMNEIFGRVRERIFSYEDIHDLIFSMSQTPYNKLYTREFLQDNMTISKSTKDDDKAFFWETLFSADSIAFLNEFLSIKKVNTHKGDDLKFNTFDDYQSVWKIFEKYDHFERHKTVLYKNCIQLSYSKYIKAEAEFKESFFQKMKRLFMNMLVDEHLYEDFMESIDEDNKRIFMQVISTKNSKIFELLKFDYNYIQNSAYGGV